jgi:hypothetical protein
MNLKKDFVQKQYYLLLLPLFFLLHGCIENYPLIPFFPCLLLLLKYLLATAILTVLSFLLIRSWQHAALFAFLVMTFHFFFGPIHDFLKNVFPNSFIIKYTFLIPVFLVLFIILLIYLRKKRPSFNNLNRYLNILFTVLILIDLVQLGIKSTKDKDSHKTLLASEFRICQNCAKPDIYLIVADEYAGKKELEDIFHFNNSEFENQLRQRGFHIIDSSKSNYNYTPFSMASMLNLNYLDKLEGRNKSLNDRNLCYRTINNNTTIDFLKSHGYEMKNCSIFQFAGKLPFASTPYYKTGMDLITAQTFISRVK